MAAQAQPKSVDPPDLIVREDLNQTSIKCGFPNKPCPFIERFSLFFMYK